MKVTLLPTPPVDPVELASHAALMCYSAEVPEFGKVIDTKERLWETGHHTTHEHFPLTFQIDGISVGDVDFGLHLTTPYYNSCQRSGRYAKMFDNPDFGELSDSIYEIYPETTSEVMDEILAYARRGLEIFNDNMERAVEVCEQFLVEDKPHLTDDMFSNAKKLAQEQLRCFIPVIVPTGLVYSIDIVTLAGLYHNAWSPAMKLITDRMVEEVLAVWPNVEYMFGERRSTRGEWAPVVPSNYSGIMFDPRLNLEEIDDGDGFVIPDRSDKFPIDHTTTSPFFMINEVGVVRAEVFVPLDLYGQDQRHRSFRRSMPNFTGNFCLPPIPAELELSSEAGEMMAMWQNLAGKVHPMLLATLAPYGAMIRYFKQGTLNAFVHEGGKRLCHLAAPGIYELNRQLREQLCAYFNWRKYLPLWEAPCQNGPCVEPKRYCGRALSPKSNYYPHRRV